MRDKKTREAPRREKYATSTERQQRTKKYVLETLRKSLGIVSKACEKAGISTFTFYNWRKEDPEFDREVEAINELALDFVESKLLAGINNGDARLIMFYLNAKGKSRGYGVKSDAAGERGGSIVLRISQEEADY